MVSAMPPGAVELQKELSLGTGLDLPPTYVFDYPSIAEMAAHLDAALPLLPPAAEPAAPKPVRIDVSEALTAQQAAAEEPAWLRMPEAQRRELFDTMANAFLIQ